MSTSFSSSDPGRDAGPSEAVQAVLAAQARISPGTRDLERWVAWAVGVHSAWLGLAVFPGAPVFWVFALYAALIGKWAEACPASQQAEMGLRAVALMTGAYWLQGHAAPWPGAVGPFVAWLALVALFYAFLLRPAWAVGVAAVAALEVVGAAGEALPAGALGQAVLSFACFAPLAIKFGASMRRADDMLEVHHIDASTGLHNEAGLLAHGDAALTAARPKGRPVTLAMFDCADLAEVRLIYGAQVARRVRAHWVSRLLRLAAGDAVAARTGPVEFTVVLPGMARSQALAAIHRVLGSPARIEFDAGGSEIVVVPGLLVRTVDPSVASIGEVSEAMRGELAAMGETERRRQGFLQRERERHSNPMPMAERPVTAGLAAN